MTDYVLFSAGEGSWRAAKLWRLLHPDADLRLVFSDVLYEDADAYRFLLEGAANVFGRTLDWVPTADEFPDYRVAEDVPIEEYTGNPDWRAFLAALRARAEVDLPELIWLVEGRDPWEVYRDERFVGNSQKDPCSKVLKREAFATWRARNCRPSRDLFAAGDRFIYGIGAHEKHRFDDGEGGGIRPRAAAQGWKCEAPLVAIDDHALGADLDLLPTGALAIAYGPLEEFGLARPRLYALGYIHNNCGGFCCKAGHAHWQLRRRVHPGRYAYDAMMERKLRVYLNSSAATILKDRRGGETRPLSLDDFAIRLAADSDQEIEFEAGSGGCGCMLDGADA